MTTQAQSKQTVWNALGQKPELPRTPSVEMGLRTKWLWQQLAVSYQIIHRYLKNSQGPFYSGLETEINM